MAPAPRLPLTSAHSVDTRRGSSSDLEAQSLWVVRDFDRPEVAEVQGEGVRNSSTAPSNLGLPGGPHHGD
jgi:hypothetical protein